VIGIIVAVTSIGIYLVFISSSQIAEEKNFLQNYYSLVESATAVTEKYHKEIEKWESDQYDDLELVNTTNSILLEYDVLVNKALSFKPPSKYQEALDLYIKSLNFESTSYALFRDFVETGDPKLNETSIDSLSNATKYELQSFNLINALR
jgi:hypothetical protein